MGTPTESLKRDVGQQPIRHLDKFKAGAINFAAFKDCFGDNKTHSGMTDIDGFKERNGYFLFIEKKAIGAEISKGQVIALERLSELPKATVIVFWGSEFKPQRAELWRGSKHIKVDNIKLALTTWFFAACHGKNVTYR